MAKVNKVRRNIYSQCHKACQLPSCSSKVLKDTHSKKNHAKSSEKREWDAATCSVCMEYPHNAVLLLCSSYNKGCRPYMCATSHRFSNCLEQYKKAYTKVTEIQCAQDWDASLDNLSITLGAGLPNERVEVSELLCPLCRGQVKGWTVVEKARKYLNAKKRTCMQDNCTFVGNYKELRKHVKTEHPLSRPRAVDPALEEKWKRLERERERNDVISTIVSTTPGAIVLGDYVIEGNHRGLFRHRGYDDDDFLGDGLFSLESFDRGRFSGIHSRSRYVDYDSFDEEDFGITRVPSAVGAAAGPGRAFHRLLFGRSRRRRRHRESNGDR